MRQFTEYLKARVNFLARKILQPLRPEAFHGKRSHYTAVKQGALQHLAIDLALRRDVSHESSGKRIAGPGRILYFFYRQRWRAKRMRSKAECSLAEKDSRPVLAVLDHQRARSHSKNFIRRARK